MSWGYWGIVAGLGVMLALFFVCLEILFPGEEKPAAGARDDSVEPAIPSSTSGRHAA
jgi:hypothetical protein